jgi:hypothetical protein
MIDQCFDIDNEFAVEILLTPSKVYSNHVPLILAESNRSRAFLATKTMRKHLDHIWYGDINEKAHSKLFIGFLVNLLKKNEIIYYLIRCSSHVSWSF